MSYAEEPSRAETEIDPSMNSLITAQTRKCSGDIQWSMGQVHPHEEKDTDMLGRWRFSITPWIVSAQRTDLTGCDCGTPYTFNVILESCATYVVDYQLANLDTMLNVSPSNLLIHLHVL